MYSAYTRNTEKNILILVFMVFLSLFFFLLAENRGTGWLGWHLSSEKKKREEKSEERKIEAQMASNTLKTSMMKSSENTQGLGSHPFDERFFKELFLNLSKRSGLEKSITKERKKDLVTQKRKHVMKRI